MMKQALSVNAQIYAKFNFLLLENTCVNCGGTERKGESVVFTDGRILAG